MKGRVGHWWQKYSPEFKQQALIRMKSGERVSALARELGVPRQILYKWRDQGWGETAQAKSGGNALEREEENPLSGENEKLKKKIVELERLLGQKPGERGSQYASNEYVERLEQAGILISMSRPARPWENAYCESFIHTLKKEQVNYLKCAALEELQQSIAEYIDEFYNPKRLHSALGYYSPEEFERKHPVPLTISPGRSGRGGPRVRRSKPRIEPVGPVYRCDLRAYLARRRPCDRGLPTLRSHSQRCCHRPRDIPRNCQEVSGP
jgi:transposase-like protein